MPKRKTVAKKRTVSPQRIVIPGYHHKKFAVKRVAQVLRVCALHLDRKKAKKATHQELLPYAETLVDMFITDWLEIDPETLKLPTPKRSKE
jgi:hypothetical protein